MYLGAESCEINIAGKYTIRGLETFEEKKSVHQIVQTAKLTLPLSYVIRNKELIERVKLFDNIKEGDSISIAYGYNGKNDNFFTGYIKRINVKQPLELELEDELYLLRKLNLTKSFKKNDVREVVQYVCDELFKKYNVRLTLYEKMPKLTVTNFIMNGVNGVSVLQELSDTYGMNSFLITIDGKKTLYCGLAYGLKFNYINYIINANTINVDDLQFKGGETESYKVKFIVHAPSGIVTKKEFGNKLGDSLTDVHLYGSFTEKEIELQAEAHLAAYKTGGYKGSFDTLLTPKVQHCDIAVVRDLQFENRKGNYYIATVTNTFGTAGGKRKVEIDFII